MKKRSIQITGARVHNLKDVHCAIPHDQLTVITGPSGSGKSSLAFDTLFAEGQRRYIESLSAYARQFFARIEKPDVDAIDHILPAIALEQKNSVKNARSTVGTATEIYDYLRILFATIGQTQCDVCGGAVNKADPMQIEQKIRALPEGSKLLILAPVSLKRIPINVLLQQGYIRIFHQGAMMDLQPLQDTLSEHDTLYVIIDRLIARQKSLSSRVLEAIKQGLTLGDGTLLLHQLDTQEEYRFKASYACVACHKAFTEPFPNMFSFNSPMGACPTCEGFGKIIGLDMDKVIPNKSLSIQAGAIHPFTLPSNRELFEDLLHICKTLKIPIDTPYENLSDEHKRVLIEGHGRYCGIREFFDWLESKKYKVHVRVMLAKYRGYYPCPDCLGARVQRDALNVRVGGRNILEISTLSITELLAFFESLPLTPLEQQISSRLIREITNRLRYLNAIGLSYLTLHRQARTLSNGEAQRINLAAALGSALTDTLYVLDEPTVGLHARDTDRLIQVLKSLRDHGNTLVVVEHDPDVILEADHVIDMGPGGGEEGGRILYEGPAKGLLDSPYSLTGQTLKNPPQPTPAKAKKSPSGTLDILGAQGNNLKNIDVSLPKNQLVCITGVSGSGKSTLVKQTLFAAYERAQGRSLQLDVAPHREIRGLDEFNEVLMVDQTPPGRSARSNPVTYIKAYDDIRMVFANTRKAMVLGIQASDFSFNSPGGRCETCQGLGTLTIDMQFMADVTVTCHECQGKRFNPNVLSVDIDGRSIDDVLNMTIDEAVSFFAQTPRIQKKLLPLQEIGLGYLRLGQSTATLSGGEAQRLKLASYLKPTSQKQEQKYLFLFDEPTTGLHLADIERLTTALKRMLQAGHSVVVIEHNLDFIAQADYIVDIGPEGGDQGGEIVAQGPVDTLIKTPASQTGQYLKHRLKALEKRVIA